MVDWRYMENFVNGKSRHIGWLRKFVHCWLCGQLVIIGTQHLTVSSDFNIKMLKICTF